MSEKRDFNWFQRVAAPARAALSSEAGSGAELSITVMERNGNVTYVRYRAIGPLHYTFFGLRSEVTDVRLNAAQCRMLPRAYIAWLVWNAVRKVLDC